MVTADKYFKAREQRDAAHDAEDVALMEWQRETFASGYVRGMTESGNPSKHPAELLFEMGMVEAKKMFPEQTRKRRSSSGKPFRTGL